MRWIRISLQALILNTAGHAQLLPTGLHESRLMRRDDVQHPSTVLATTMAALGRLVLTQ